MEHGVDVCACGLDEPGVPHVAKPDVEGAAPYLDAEGMVRAGSGAIVGVRVRGIDPARVGTVTDLQSDLLPGSESAL